jgi:hypothetical protein
MVAIAECESGLIEDAISPTNDGGLFQLNWSAHGSELTRRGIDRLDADQNIAYARELYDRDGLQPWYMSRSCWEYALYK